MTDSVTRLTNWYMRAGLINALSWSELRSAHGWQAVAIVNGVEFARGHGVNKSAAREHAAANAIAYLASRGHYVP